MNIGDLVFRLLVDDKGLEAQVSSAATKAGTTGGQGFTKSFGAQLKGGLGQARSGILQGLGLAGGLGIAGVAASAASAITGFMGESVAAASNLNESISKSRAVFDESSASIERWAETASRSFGQSKRQAIDTAAGFGSLFETVGLAVDESIGMSTELTELGSDLASFYNTTVDEALTALRSGLIGEAEPMRRFGALLSETRVRAKAMSMGLADASGEISDAAKVSARYALILEDTSTAQGDFARTADGLANKQRTATARMEDAQAVLGEKLLPISLAFTDAMIALADAIGPAVEGLGELGRMADEALEPVGGLGTVLGQVFAIFNPMGAAAGRMADDVKAAMEQAGAATDEAFMEWRGSEARTASAVQKGITGPFEDEVNTLDDAARKAALDAVEALAKELSDGASNVNAAIIKLREAAEDPMDDLSRIAALEGILTGQELADGLASSDPYVRQAAAELRDELMAEIAALKGAAKTGGKNVGIAFAAGIDSSSNAIRDAARRAAAAARPYFRGFSPPKVGPLKDIDKWGVNIGRTFADSLVEGMATLDLASMVPSSADLAPPVPGTPGTPGTPEATPPPPPQKAMDIGRTFADALVEGISALRSDLAAMVPSGTSRMATAASPQTAVVAPAPSTGDTNYNVSVEGLIEARDPFEIATQMRRFGEVGLLTTPAARGIPTRA